jgi:hypothetical protein
LLLHYASSVTRKIACQLPLNSACSRIYVAMRLDKVGQPCNPKDVFIKIASKRQQYFQSKGAALLNRSTQICSRPLSSLSL